MRCCTCECAARQTARVGHASVALRDTPKWSGLSSAEYFNCTCWVSDPIQQAGLRIIKCQDAVTAHVAPVMLMTPGCQLRIGIYQPPHCITCHYDTMCALRTHTPTRAHSRGPHPYNPMGREQHSACQQRSSHKHATLCLRAAARWRVARRASSGGHKLSLALAARALLLQQQRSWLATAGADWCQL